MNSSLARTHTIALFGGSGATGNTVVRHAMARGFKMRVLVRNANSIRIRSGLTDFIEGSLTDPGDVSLCLKGCDTAICVFGQRPPYTDIFCEAATRTIVAAMKKNGVSHLVCQTGAMIGDYPGNRTLPFRLMTALFNRRRPLVAADRAAQEEAVKRSSLAWTLVKPARLSSSTPKGKWVLGPGVRAGLLSSISREDLADFLLEEAIHPHFIGEAVFIHG